MDLANRMACIRCTQISQSITGLATNIKNGKFQKMRKPKQCKSGAKYASH